jgi:hypothetical protein
MAFKDSIGYLHLAIGPGMAELCKSMINTIDHTNLIKGVSFILWPQML